MPYPPIRRPVAQHAPFLLTPSYVSMDYHFRQATASLEAAKQLIDGATAPADLALGEQKLKQAQTSLDQLPTWIWNELPNTYSGYWWYGSRFSRLGFNTARAELGRLQGKVFQEKNAQTTLIQAEQALTAAEQQYKQAKTPTEQQVGLNAWQAGVDQMRQVPSQTLAGKMAQQKISATQRDLEAMGGLAVGNQQTISLIGAAKQFAWQAAQAGQHAPHSVTEWQQAIDLWQEAIYRLKQVSVADGVGYTAAQTMMAEYTTNQGRIEVRQQTEARAVQSFEQANRQINQLIANMPQGTLSNRPDAASQLQQIINQLAAIDSGTTVYAEAQILLASAKQKLNQWQVK